jgi:phosphoribosylaminoimidazole (AIR) synthetase
VVGADALGAVGAAPTRVALARATDAAAVARAVVWTGGECARLPSVPRIAVAGTVVAVATTAAAQWARLEGAIEAGETIVALASRSPRRLDGEWLALGQAADAVA